MPAVDDALPFPAALAFLGAALVHVLTVLAPPAALVEGLAHPLVAAIGLGAVAAAAALVTRAPISARLRIALHAGAAIVLLYLASVVLASAFQPELYVRQQGQVLLSMLWALTGVAALLAGLVRDSRPLRVGALALLAVTAGKVFAFDLASLTSLYRVGSCPRARPPALLGAFAWQRIRPRPLPDLRRVPGALR